MTDESKKNFDSSDGNRPLTSEELVQRLRRALSRQGDFPASARIVSELRSLTADPKVTANQITEVILREPSLGVRVLHLVNSSFYRRAKPIMTVSQAVVQIGMKPLAEMCAGLVLLQKFVPAARRGGAFATCLKRTVITSLLASTITPAAKQNTPGSRNQEFGYLAGSFSELGTLLLAFYFPQLYEASVKRADAKKTEVGQAIKELTGLSPLQLSLEVIDALDLPVFYKEVLNASESIAAGLQSTFPPDVARLAKSVGAARTISEAVVNSRGKEDLEVALSAVSARFGIDSKALGGVITALPQVFKQHCDSLDLQLPDLPPYIAAAGSPPVAGQTPPPPTSEQEDMFTQFVSEIRVAVESREPTASVITSVMETCAFSLKFDRVLLLLVNNAKSKLTGRLLLGSVPGFEPKKFERILGDPHSNTAPEIRCIREARPVFQGEPIFKDGWPIAVLPIGFGARSIGAIYCDRTAKGDTELSSRESAAFVILAELLDRSLSLQT